MLVVVKSYLIGQKNKGLRRGTLPTGDPYGTFRKTTRIGAFSLFEVLLDVDNELLGIIYC
jgi:hypothetical protein